MEPGDAELVQRAQAGDSDAFGALVRRYQEKVYMVAFQMTHNHSDADELSQAAFLRAFEALPKFRADAAFFSWMYRITTNLCLNHLQAQKRSVPLPEPVSGDDPPSAPELASQERTEAAAESADDSAQLWAALDTLSPELRAAAVAVYLHDMSPKQAAQALGCAEATVHWRMFKARKLLKKALA